MTDRGITNNVKLNVCSPQCKNEPYGNSSMFIFSPSQLFSSFVARRFTKSVICLLVLVGCHKGHWCIFLVTD